MLDYRHCTENFLHIKTGFVPRLRTEYGTKIKRVSIRVSIDYLKLKHSKYMVLFAVFYSYYRHHPLVFPSHLKSTKPFKNIDIKRFFVI